MTTLNSRATEGAGWTAADILSTSRYWGLVLGVLLGAMAMRGLYASVPMVLTKTGAGYEAMGFVSSGSMLGWVVGGMVAMLLMPGRAKLALILPVAVFAAVMAGIAALPVLWTWIPLLFLLGVCSSAFALLSIAAVASTLLGARLSKTDFLLVLSLPLLLLGIVPEIAVMASVWTAAAGYLSPLAYGLLACAALALLVLGVGKPHTLAGDAPVRHKPLTYHHRSPLLIALIGLAPLCFAGLYQGTYMAVMRGEHVEALTLLVLQILAILVSLLAAVYLLYWLYRIHGEAAGQAPSRQLLSPRAALFIAWLVPLGYFLVIIALGRVLRERTLAQPATAPLSGRWLAFWAIVVPPVAMAMLQGAVNRLEHATPEPRAAV